MENWKRNTTRFLLGQTISLFGSSLVQYAIMWYITLNTQSGAMMTISIISGFLPTFFLSPFAGVWADRFNRKFLIVGADSMIAFATLILAILFLLGYDAIWLLFVMSAIRAVGSGIQQPAINAMLPQLVPEDKLTKVNGTNSSLQSMVMLVSPMVSAPLLEYVPLSMIFFIDVVTAVIGVGILLWFVQVPVHAKAQAQQTVSYLSDLAAGLKYIRRHDFVLAFCLFNAAFLFLAAPACFLTPLQVTRTFGDEVWRLSAIEVFFAVGMMIGGGLIAIWGGLSNKIHMMIAASSMFGICTFLLGVVPYFWLYLLVMGIFGLSMPFFNTPFMVLLQQKVEQDYLGRVFGVFTMISSSMMPFGMIVFGPVADYVKIEWLLIGTGVLLFLLTLSLLFNKTIMKAGQPVAETN